MKQFTSLLGIIMMSIFCIGCQAAPLQIVSQGKSSFTIIIADNAPSSVQAAAEELQTDIEKATGANLPIRKDDTKMSSAVICLGQNKFATSAGINVKGIALEGFRVVTKNGNLYILGIDTPDGQSTDDGGTSNGTANGVYSFLEKYLGVRWLMPGELGKVVPKKSTFTIPLIDFTDAPFFINRREPYIQNEKEAVTQWENHQKLGYSFRITHGHSWTRTVKPELFKEHPDWFAMVNGKRVPPSGRYKLETTNTDLVNYFAQQIIEEFQKNPGQNIFSLSPSDSRGWSQSPQSKALYDPVPSGHKYPSVTPLVLKFYRDVTQIVAQKYPKCKLAGYIYADYLYPPQKDGMILPDNFYPVIAPSIDYGFTLYRPDVRQDFNELLEGWSKITPHLFYYDLPNTIHPNAAGIITPPGTDILNFIYPRLVKNNVKGVYIYGSSAWGQAALANYIIAKMNWNPYLDANDIQHDWLIHAYGPKAGAAMESFYQKLDGWFGDYYRINDEASYRITDAMLKGLYGKYYPQLEELFLTAKNEPMTIEQKHRLNLVGDNLVVLQSRLRDRRALPADYRSLLGKSDDEVMEILTTYNKAFDLFPDIDDSAPAIKPMKVTQLAPLNPITSKPVSVHLRNKNLLLIYSQEGGKVTIMPNSVREGKLFVGYILKDNTGILVKRGIFHQNEPISWSAKAGEPYYLYIHNGIYNLTILDAAVAIKTNMDKQTLHLFGSPTTLYLDVPKSITQWRLKLSSETPAETAKITINSPDGKQTILQTVTQPAQEATLKGTGGLWQIELTKASSGVLDDIHLHFDASLPSWVSVDASRPLHISVVH